MTQLHPNHPRTARLQSAFLLVIAAGLIPIALAYGVVPAKSLPWLFGIDAQNVPTRHIFRAVMGLYLGLICFWVTGAFNPTLRIPALWSLFVFATGLALGRLGSFALDGWPNALLVAYFGMEISAAAISAWLLRTPAPSPQT